MFYTSEINEIKNFVKEKVKNLVEKGVLKEEQADLVERIITVIRKKETGIFEAYTGFGKTRSLLIGAILANLTKITFPNLTFPRKIFISCHTKDQQNHYQKELKNLQKTLEDILQVKIKVVGPYSIFFDNEKNKSLENLIKIVFFKGKRNYVLKKKLLQIKDEYKLDEQLWQEFFNLIEKAKGDIEVAKLIDNNGLINKVSQKIKIDLSEILANIYTDVRSLNEDEYIKQIRKEVIDSDIVICNHYLLVHYINYLYRMSGGEVEKDDILRDIKNFERQVDFDEQSKLLTYEDAIIFDEAHNLMYVYLNSSSRMRTLRKGIFLYNNLYEKVIKNLNDKERIVKEFNELKDIIKDIKSGVEEIKAKKKEMIEKSEEKINIEELCVVPFLADEHKKLILKVIESNLMCINKIKHILDIVKKSENENVEEFRKEVEEDEKFFKDAKEVLQQQELFKQGRKKKANKEKTNKEEENLKFHRLFLSFSDEYLYPSLHFACNLRSFKKKINKFESVIYSSATLRSTFSFDEDEDEILHMQNFSKLYPLTSLGITYSHCSCKFYFPKKQYPIQIYVYKNSYIFAKEKKDEEFFETLKKYLDLISEEIKEILKEQKGKTILLGKSYKEIYYLEEKLEKEISFLNKGKESDFLYGLTAIKEQDGVVLFVGRYEGYDLPTLSNLLLTRIPFVSYETLYFLHNETNKTILNLYNLYEATIKLKQVLGRLMRGNNIKHFYILDSRIGQKGFQEFLEFCKTISQFPIEERDLTKGEEVVENSWRQEKN
ncbi:MAG: hypothetical protein QW067_11005 [Thermofilaceae archaeon]